MIRSMLLRALLVAALAAAPAASGEEPGIDPATGLKIAPDWQLVRNNCIACHSLRLVTQQRGTAAHWLELIRWMQATQNLWQFDADTEQRIVAYLAANYPPSDDRRRAPIPKSLMPPNPYSGGESD